MNDLSRQSHVACTLLKEMSHPTRLTILCNLCEGELCVNELQDRMGLRQSNLSQHLGRLRAARLVTGRRDCNKVYYSISTPEAGDLLRALQAIYCLEDDGAAQAA